MVRAFILMREQMAAHKELAGKLADLEQRVGGHDAAIQDLFEAIRQLVEPLVPENRREIGFHVRETAPLYRIKTRPRM
jgi:seryl-tRNA synthetase